MVKVIGAGLAGCEAAWQLANAGIDTELYEMKPVKYSPAHHYSGFAELVCSNSLKASRIDSAAGLLKAEMKAMNSLVVKCAEESAVEAGGALAVDRKQFSDLITQNIKSSEHIKVINEEVTEIPDGDVIIATGPLTSDKLAESISKICGEYLSFFDAASPIVTYESLDKNLVFFASRYDRGEADYINCPMNKEEYLEFYNALINAESAELKDFDKKAFKVYEGCMPIEVLAKRGEDTMRFGPLKPVGLVDKRTGKRPYAVVQLRKENREGTMYNLVGFQTNLKFGEQKRVFSKITGLADAEFVRYGVMHRNSFINSPKLLNSDYSLRTRENLYFAGQITGVEGYIESAASGILAGINMAARLMNRKPLVLPPDTMCGALTAYISDSYNVENFQPMGCNMGILPELPEKIRDKKLKYQAYADRAMASLRNMLEEWN
ncbi:MAG TPA: methylenetetrahydrofolate--tRNA-(uracil(54)-C(5))-methyltransferase (FADH(2)-oxidizing) TrmFO [Ruminococcus sp.]|nr:methylenetetrahydrofolate--tRNA-(uracil(54)-C(5))-methyltransferase (FADH(2)-oxidizing) TrmFO [Ruminococcus sp.]HBN11953.1 methylenetetrahydrofolate--tRNA-(uracil(54)-C(5))-methyltransferase (FADH(2)-oxidizing) TrmFO [Ruminococcus sp.]HCR73803.1 methylenetetrahydrofolate--tRNA-(uracil(54)-C(5))-methyltransferase (FADH(2)-oxidizing) TrmFO [Ruminococcus sp.]